MSITDKDRDFWEKMKAAMSPEERRLQALFDAKMAEAQTLRLQEGHKARERTLRSLEMGIDYRCLEPASK